MTAKVLCFRLRGFYERRILLSVKPSVSSIGTFRILARHSYNTVVRKFVNLFV